MPRKKMTVANIRKDDATLVKKKIVKVKDYDVEVHTVFRKTEANKLVAEMLNKIDEANQEGVNISANVLYYVLLIKYFTNIIMPEDVKEQVAILNMMIDNDLLVPILEAFPSEELIKISDALNSANQFLDSQLKVYRQQLDLDFDEEIKKAIEEGKTQKE